MNLTQTKRQKIQPKIIPKGTKSIKFNKEGQIEFSKKIKDGPYFNKKKQICLLDEEDIEHVVDEPTPEQKQIKIKNTADQTVDVKTIESESKIVLDALERVEVAASQLHSKVALAALGIGASAAVIAALTSNKKSNSVFNHSYDKKDNEDHLDNSNNKEEPKTSEEDKTDRTPSPSISEPEKDKDEINKDELDKEKVDESDENSQLPSTQLPMKNPMVREPFAKAKGEFKENKNLPDVEDNKGSDNKELPIDNIAPPPDKNKQGKLEDRDGNQPNGNKNTKIEFHPDLLPSDEDKQEKNENYSEWLVKKLEPEIAGFNWQPGTAANIKKLLLELIETKNTEFSREKVDNSDSRIKNLIEDIASDKVLLKLFNNLFEENKDKLVGEDKLFNEDEYLKIKQSFELGENNEDNPLPADLSFLERLDKAILKSENEKQRCETIILLNNLFQGKTSYTKSDKDNELREKVVESILQQPELILDIKKANGIWRSNLKQLVGDNKLFTGRDWEKIVPKNEEQIENINLESNLDKEKRMQNNEMNVGMNNTQAAAAFLKTCQEMFGKDLSMDQGETIKESKDTKGGVDNPDVDAGKESKETKGEIDPATGKPKEETKGEIDPETGKPKEETKGEVDPETGKPKEETKGEVDPETGKPKEETKGEVDPATGKPKEETKGEVDPETGKPKEETKGEIDPATGKPKEETKGEVDPATGKPKEETKGEIDPETGKPKEETKGEVDPATGKPKEETKGEVDPETGKPKEETKGKVDNPDVDAGKEGKDVKGGVDNPDIDADKEGKDVKKGKDNIDETGQDKKPEGQVEANKDVKEGKGSVDKTGQDKKPEGQVAELGITEPKKELSKKDQALVDELKKQFDKLTPEQKKAFDEVVHNESEKIDKEELIDDKKIDEKVSEIKNAKKPGEVKKALEDLAANKGATLTDDQQKEVQAKVDGLTNEQKGQLSDDTKNFLKEQGIDARTQEEIDGEKDKVINDNLKEKLLPELAKQIQEAKEAQEKIGLAQQDNKEENAENKIKIDNKALEIIQGDLSQAMNHYQSAVGKVYEIKKDSSLNEIEQVLKTGHLTLIEDGIKMKIDIKDILGGSFNSPNIFGAAQPKNINSPAEPGESSKYEPFQTKNEYIPTQEY